MTKTIKDGSNAKTRSASQAWAEATGANRRSSGFGSSGATNAAKKDALIVVILIVACVLAFAWAAIHGIKQGLDIQGGVSVVMTATKPDGTSVTDQDMDSAVAIVTNRVNSLGANEATVQRQGSDQILIQIPGATDPQQAIDTVGTTGVLEFVDLNDIQDTEALIRFDASGTTTLEPGTYTAFMTGDDLAGVSIDSQSQGSPYYAVNLRLTSAGARAFAEVTQMLAPSKSRIAIVLDGVVQSAPAVQSVISDGRVAITGNYTRAGAEALKTVLESGSLPVALELSDSRYVGPTLGQDSLRQGLMAVGVGFAIILVYLFIFYRGLGLVTAGALLAFGILYVGLLSLLSSNNVFALSLPGIAGVVLTIGMAADSSILVLERFKEELRDGRVARLASVSGSKHGIHTALDAGIVSLISALGLFFITTGAVKGFGFTLALGVIVSFIVLLMFTTPFLRLLARNAIPTHPVFWGVSHDVEEGATGRQRNAAHLERGDANA